MDPFGALGVGQVLPEPLLLVEEGRVLAANAAARAALGVAIAGRPLQELVHDPADRLQALLRFASRTVEMVPGSLTFAAAEGAVEYFVDACRAAPPPGPPRVLLRLRPKAARLRAFRLLSDRVEALTEEVKRRAAVEAALRSSQAELADRIREAEEANRLKDEFLATLSHELRTPLHAIVGWSHVLRSTPPDATTLRRGLEAIARNAEMQTRLVSDLLDVSRVVSGRMRLHVALVDFAEVIEQAVESVGPAAAAKHIELLAVLDREAGPVWGDPDRLQQVAWNLLSNAVKFTPRGGRVQVRLRAANSQVQVEVEDNGPGLPEAFLPRAFDRFRQGDASSSRQHGGLGLGLAIVRHLVDLHGGTVAVRNHDQRSGAVFTVTLPRASVSHPPLTEADVATPESVAGPSPPEAPLLLRGLRVLVVEDEPDSREIVAHVLERHGAEVFASASAADAFDAVRRHRPDLILSDIEMPGGDGYELLRRVRTLPAASGGSTPAVALSAYAGTEHRIRALRAGFQLHLAKPIAPEELAAAVASLAGRLSAPE